MGDGTGRREGIGAVVWEPLLMTAWKWQTQGWVNPVY